MTDKLLKGFKEFRKETYEGHDALMPQLVEDGQKPDYFIISCIDSRSNSGTLFKPPPGAFFSHKAMGAIVRPYEKGTALSAALHFALHYNGVKNIILLGHTHCGGVKALVDELDDDEITSFISVAKKGLEQAKACCGESADHNDLLREAEKKILLQSTENLKTYPSVQKALENNQLTIKSWLFDMEAGDILEYQKDKKEFINITITTQKQETHHA